MTDSTSQVASQPLPASAWAVADDQRLIRISGPGTDKFLQGQFSQSLADVTATFSPRAAACTPKGRAYCLTRLVRDGDDVLMAVPDVLIDTISTQLRKYLMLFRGTEMRVLDDARILGIIGHGLAEQLCPDRISELDRPGASLALDTDHLIRTEDTAEGLPRYELWQLGDPAAARAPVLSTEQQTSPVNWRAAEIAAGIATLTPDTLEAYVPQMLNWQHVGGVHFKKGCYTGQEVIARMHFLGQLKKSLFRFSAEGLATAPAPGTAVLADGKSVGEVISSVVLADDSVQCLAVVRHDAAEGDLHLDSAAGPSLHRLGLPYPVPEQSAANKSDT
ncbi:MAG: YgfZ/GcvT domain-containing protein [Marinobacter sp.]|uniref:CAF17-like 4Fe-4S cluster assembly/insertion protein YgfZ n=1 Tax=Marinobacter sp. TaxID=50741 RepID=UPI003C3CF1CE